MKNYWIIAVLMFAFELSAEETNEETITTEVETNYQVPCLRCERKNHLNIQVLGLYNTPLGVSGLSMTRHLLDRTSVQGGIGYGFGGVNLSGGFLHYLEKDISLYVLTGLSLTAGKRDSNKHDRYQDNIRDDSYQDNLEGLWVNVGFGGDISTQSGVSYGFDFGLSMAVLSDVLSRKIKVCFGAIADDDCEQPWRIMPYLTLLKLGYSW